ncbi:hypothetical protein DXC92_01235 [Clostridiales bacterium TF09-2AC]|nr:hypothetical protein DXC92_01235 [Clostridiales bacterium TF09-2AC]
MGTTKYKISKPLSGQLTCMVYNTFPETARGGTAFAGGGWQGGHTRGWGRRKETPLKGTASRFRLEKSLAE